MIQMMFYFIPKLYHIQAISYNINDINTQNNFIENYDEQQQDELIKF